MAVRLALAFVWLASSFAGPAAAAERGTALFSLCSQCHGAAGEGNPAFTAPAIAGLPLWYVQSQLMKFRSGLRGTHFDDVNGMRMRPMALSLRSEADIQAVAAHVARLARVPPAPSVQGGDAGRGAAAYAVCASCHGARGEGSQEQSAPPLAGQSDWYLLSSLHQFKDGVRGGNLNDMTAVMMRPMALSLADEQAMKDIVAYIETFSR